MNNELRARALAVLPSGEELPGDIQMFPPGKGVEFTLMDFPGERFRMDVGPEVAAQANADLQRMIGASAQGTAPAPFADKNHEDGEAVFHPQEIYWAGNDAKAGGVRVKTEWTGFG